MSLLECWGPSRRRRWWRCARPAAGSVEKPRATGRQPLTGSRGLPPIVPARSPLGRGAPREAERATRTALGRRRHRRRLQGRGRRHRRQDRVSPCCCFLGHVRPPRRVTLNTDGARPSDAHTVSSPRGGGKCPPPASRSGAAATPIPSTWQNESWCGRWRGSLISRRRRAAPSSHDTTCSSETDAWNARTSDANSSANVSATTLVPETRLGTDAARIRLNTPPSP